MAFQENYLGHSPAWVCQNSDCGYRQFLRQRRTADELTRAARNLDARVRRFAMKARTKANQAARHIARTDEQLTRKRRKTGL